MSVNPFKPSATAGNLLACLDISFSPVNHCHTPPVLGKASETEANVFKALHAASIVETWVVVKSPFNMPPFATFP